VIVHARKAWLSGLSPKQNREIPPLRYNVVFDLKAAFPDLEIILNGGLESLDAAQGALDYVDGVMLGRTAYKDPWIMSGVDEQFFGDPSAVTDRIEVIEKYIPYIEAQLAEGVPLNAMTRHILGLFNGVPGARAWRRYLSENATGLGVEPGQGAGVEVVRDALALMQDHAQTNAA